MAKKFMYVCLGILMLAVAYHLAIGPQAAESQEDERPVLMSGDALVGTLWVMTDQGNLYQWGGGSNWYPQGRWTGMPPTEAQPTTWSQIKAEFGE